LSPLEKPLSISRRSIFFQSCFITASLLLSPPQVATAAEDDPRRIVTIQLMQKGDSLGVQIADSTLRGKTVVVISRVLTNRRLQEGMILKNCSSSKEVIERIRNGPYPMTLEFENLAAGGDAFDDLGTTMVTPKDAFQLAQETDSKAGISSSNKNVEYSITTTPATNKCAIQSRRGDVLEIHYEAYYYNGGDKQLYDASEFRGTGQPYQMVLGSGDMIPGVDQGLYRMCPGEIRDIIIPPILGYGKNALKRFRIPSSYQALEWRVELITIDSTIRQDNNHQTREEREGRALY
jgi:FKBP-type peptidyl-prolyl cis-trans isomerase